MKMRTLILFTIVLCGINCYSHEAPKFRRHEIGFNATLFVKQFVNFNSNAIPFSPYQLTYKYLTKKNVNFRTGAGASSSKKTETMENREPKTTKNYMMNYRIGFEKQSVISKHWNCYYGLDFTYDYTDLNSNLFSGSVRDREKGFGMGPVLGIQYYFNERVSVFTEMGFIYKNLKTELNIVDNNNPLQNQNIKSNEMSGNIFIPTTIFIAIKI